VAGNEAIGKESEKINPMQHILIIRPEEFARVANAMERMQAFAADLADAMRVEDNPATPPLASEEFREYTEWYWK
jgi:hypothetical protein